MYLRNRDLSHENALRGAFKKTIVMLKFLISLFQMKLLGDNINEGDVILCNHPSCGGSHLPDLTVITPVMFPLFVFCYLNF